MPWLAAARDILRSACKRRGLKKFERGRGQGGWCGGGGGVKMVDEDGVVGVAVTVYVAV